MSLDRRVGFKSLADDLTDVYRLNVELLDTLSVVSMRIFQFAEQHGIEIDGLDSLLRLVQRANTLIQEIGKPYRGKLGISDAILQGKRSDEDLTEPG